VVREASRKKKIMRFTKGGGRGKEEEKKRGGEGDPFLNPSPFT